MFNLVKYMVLGYALVRVGRFVKKQIDNHRRPRVEA